MVEYALAFFCVVAGLFGLVVTVSAARDVYRDWDRY